MEIVEIMLLPEEEMRRLNRFFDIILEADLKAFDDSSIEETKD
ncbi:MAG: hypothetical protein V2A70_08210 [Candidatus Omnitrophota bacterium]